MRLDCLPVILLCASLAACSGVKPDEPVASINMQPEAIGKELIMQANQTVPVSAMYQRTLKQSTRWRYAGSLPQGEIFRPINTVFTVEGMNVQEAYLVVNAGQLVGYYLPVERTYSRLDQTIQLNVAPNNPINPEKINP